MAKKELEIGEWGEGKDCLLYRAPDKVYRLKVPKRPSICQDIYSAALTNSTRALAACVGLSMITYRPTANYQRMGCSTVMYGGAVMDELVDRGWKPTDVIAVGQRLFEQVQDHLISYFPSSADVKEASDFLEETQD